MKYVLDGCRAAVVMALILALWSFVGVTGAMESESESAGMTYVISAFGMLGLPQVLYGLLLGAIVAGWGSFLKSALGGRIAESMDDSLVDRQVAALVAAVPALAGVLAAVVLVMHLVVTSKFVRAQFQALGLAAIAAVTMVGLIAATPLILKAFEFFMRLLPEGRTGRGRATQSVLVVLVVLSLVAVTAGYVYASNLQVFSGQMLRMAVLSVLGVPALMVAFSRLKVDGMGWTFGVPLTGGILVVVAFMMAGGLTSSSAPMRLATTQHSALVAFEARFLQRFADGDGDGYSSKWGGADCDDANADIHPGARDIPGNGIDESCSGEDAALPSGNDHPSRKIVVRALDAAGAAARKEAEQIPDPPKNLIVLLIDTLRVDHLGFAGYERPTSPNMDALAKESVVFTGAYATSPHTPRSIPAIFVGRYASRTKWRGAQYNYPRVEADNVSFVEVLQENGHRNFGFSSHHYFQEKRGLAQGFEVWNNDGFGTIAESNDDIASPRIWEIVEPKIEELAKFEKPFSLFVHLFEPHARWIAHPEYDFGKGDTPEQRHINSYDSEIAYVDNYVGKIVQKLKDTGLWENSVVVLVSDHGEAFNEHGYFFHGQTLYNEVVRVPLIVRVPGWKHRVVETPVSILDVPPTVLDLMSYAVPEEYDGTSLAPLMLGETPENRPVFMELLPYTSWKEHHKAVVMDNLKFIHILSSGAEELYDLAADPGEKKNLAGERPEDAERMRKLIESFQNQ